MRARVWPAVREEVAPREARGRHAPLDAARARARTREEKAPQRAVAQVEDARGAVTLRVDGSGHEPLAASPQFDLWSLGVIAFRSLARRPLFNSDDRDNMRNDDELRRLWRWNVRSVADAARAVMREMREPSPFPRALYAANGLMMAVYTSISAIG